MKKMPIQHLSQLAVVSALAASSLVAGIQTASADSFSVDDKFQPGWHEASIGSSVYISDLIVGYNRPDINYASGFIQTAFTLNSPGNGMAGEGPLRGSLQLAPELFGAGIFHGPGSYIAGGTIWLRYLFVRPGWRVVPFIEGGAGLTSMDIPHNYDGKDFNFNLNLGGGVRYFVCDRASLNLEYRFQHISNADLWKKNIGVNAGGPSASITVYF